MNLVLLFEADRIDANRYVVSDHRSEHIRNILKLSAGDSLHVGLLNGPQGPAVIDSIDDDRVYVSTGELNKREPRFPTIDIICALPRPQTLKKLLFISGMTGIRNLYLIRANRVEKSYFHSPLLESFNYNKYLYEGLSQGKRTRLPKIGIHARFKQFFEDELENLEGMSQESIRLLPDIEHDGTLKGVYPARSSHVIIAIGPEGGWVPFEVDIMTSRGFKKFWLSSSILRVEHALMACLSQIELLDR